MKNKMMVSIPEIQKNAYPIFIGSNVILNPKKWLPNDTNLSAIVIITDHTVKKYYGTALKNLLKSQGHPCFLIAFPAGEKYKNNQTKIKIENTMLRRYCDRKTLILALGGGVVGDMAGFIAGTYMRGIPYIQLPTTLLSMVDSSVGGKTGLDTPQGKNLIGLFNHPQCVVMDVGLLSTLSQKNIINGLIEAIKVFMTNDVKSLKYTQRNLNKILLCDSNVIKELVARAITLKASIVERDEKEQGQRAILNFGHTIGHALEHLSQYKIPHGFAVAYGILVEAKISQLLGLLPENDYVIIKNLITALGINGTQLKKYPLNHIIQQTKLDKKNQAGKVRYVLLRRMGCTHVVNNTFVHSVTDKLVKQAIHLVSEG
jgi:3-dehydroquinate synthase